MWAGAGLKWATRQTILSWSGLQVGVVHLANRIPAIGRDYTPVKNTTAAQSDGIAPSKNTSAVGFARHDWAVLAMLATSLIVNVVLGSWAFASHRRTVANARLRDGVAVGAVVGPLDAKGLDGSAKRIDWTSTVGSTVLYVMKSDCVWCARNLANYRAMASGLQRDRLVMVSLDKDGEQLRSYVAKEGLAGEIVFDPPESVRVEFGLGLTPQTLVISPKGVVVKAWRGAYGKREVDEIARFFSIMLPQPQPQPQPQ